MNGFLARLSPRERMLAALVAAALFVILNLVLLRSFANKHRLLRAERERRAFELQSMSALFSERETWLARDNWLQEKQPRLENEGSAGVQLLDEVKQAAKQNEVTLENPAIGTVARSPFARAVPVTVEARGSWAGMVTFLQGLQGPEKFIVFESANLEIDPADATRIRAKLKVARWFTP
jgi:hypothetical protein